MKSAITIVKVEKFLDMSNSFLMFDNVIKLT